VFYKFVAMKYLISIFFIVLTASCNKSEKSIPELRIVYNVNYDTLTDDYEIFSMKLDGSDKKNISNSKGVDWVYYAYKDKVYFVSDRDTTHRMYFLYEMDANGKNVRKVTDLRLEDSSLGSRNNGKELIVAGRVGKEIRQQLFIINTETGGYAPVAQDTGASFNSPYFSPDGSMIVFRYRKNKRNYENEKAELWIMNADGSNKKQLTYYPEADTTANWFDYHAGAPTWDPNQNLISYMSMQKGNYSIFTITPDGTETTQLTADSLGEGWHAWSPDGQWMVFDVSGLNGEYYDVCLMENSTKKVKKLTDDWRTEQAPVFVEVKK
jgi:TolB protein